MRSKTLAIVIYILPILLLGMSCLLDNSIWLFATNETTVAWGRFFTRTCASTTFVGLGVVLIIVPENWLKKNIPLYKPHEVVSKIVAGIVCIAVGVMGIFLNIWVLMRFLKYF